MTVGIHVDQYGKFCDFLLRYEKILDFNNIPHIRLDVNDECFWEALAKVDLFIFRWSHYDWYYQLAHTILPIIEKELKIKCFPSQVTCWHFDDKIRQYYLLKIYDSPIIKSWIFWDRQKALEWSETADYPVVFKLKKGAGSQNVLLVKDENKAKHLINLMFGDGIKSNKIGFSGTTWLKDFNFYKEMKHAGRSLYQKAIHEDSNPIWEKNKNYILFQRYLPGNAYDTRVTVIGNRAFAFIRYNRDNDFRSSGSGKIDYDTDKIDLRFIKLAFDISIKLKFQSMAFDFIYDSDRNPYFCEISYTYVDQAVYNSNGYWDPSLNFHYGHFWPQYCQLVDLLNIPELKQPEFQK